MLLGLRDRISGYLAWVFVALISIPFVLWGVQEYVGVGQTSYAVKVNGEQIPLNEYDRMMSTGRMNIAQSFGGRIPSSFDVNSYLRNQTLEQLIQRELMDQLFEEHNYRIDGSMLQKSILQDSYFQIDGKFSNERYRAEIASRGIGPREYENMLKRQMLIDQLAAGLEKTAFVSEKEMADYVQIAHQTRDFAYILIPYSSREKSVRATDEEIEKYYDENAAMFMTDEFVKIEYIEFSLAEMAKNISVSDELLRGLYKSAVDAGRYQTEEVRDGSHILIRVPDTADTTVVAEKRKKAEEILQRLRQGEDFAAIAKQESEDPGSAQQGGALGDVRRGVMVKPFEDALFALKKGELSEPVLTRFGFHIIKINSIQPPQVEAFNNVKTQLEEDYRKEQTDAVFYDRVDRLQTLSFENPGEQLAVIAEQVGVPVRESGFFSRNDSTGIAAYAGVRDAAFSGTVLLEKQNSGLIEVDDNHVVVLRVKEHRPSQPKTLAEARSEIAVLVKQQKAAEAVAEAADKVLAEMVDGKPDTVARRYSAEYKSLVDVKRDDQSFPEEIGRAVFKMATPADGPVLTKITLSNGDAAVLRLTKVKAGDIAWLDAAKREQLRQQIQQARGGYDYNAMLAAVKEAADIVINPDLQ